MTITLRPGATVVFAGDSITEGDRHTGAGSLGHGFPLLVAGRWGLRHPDRPVTWINAGMAGDTVTDLEARWRRDVLDARPDLVTVLVGINDVARHTYDPDGHVVSPPDFAAGYARLLGPLVDAGATVVLVEPFLLPIHREIEVGKAKVGPAQRARWRAELDPVIDAVRGLARTHGAHLIAADAMFTQLAQRAAPEHWADDGVHPTPAGHAALADAWWQVVT